MREQDISRERDARPVDMKVGKTVRVASSGLISIGRIIRVEEGGWTAMVRLPNWHADGVHLDMRATRDRLKVGVGRADVCRCCYCK